MQCVSWQFPLKRRHNRESMPLKLRLYNMETNKPRWCGAVWEGCAGSAYLPELQSAEDGHRLQVDVRDFGGIPQFFRFHQCAVEVGIGEDVFAGVRRGQGYLGKAIDFGLGLDDLEDGVGR